MALSITLHQIGLEI